MSSILRSILFVDDEADIRQIVKLLLSRDDITIHDFDSGDSALANAPVEPPDIILMDLMMHGMDGLETLSKLRCLSGYQNVPCVFFTAKADAHTLAVLQECENADVIYKPFKMQNFLSNIEDIYTRLKDQDEGAK